MNNTTLLRASEWLHSMGIRTIPNTTHLLVNRADMMNTASVKSSQEACDIIMEALKNDVSTKLFWGEKESTMGWVCLESF